jgi:hypothetical protein
MQRSFSDLEYAAKKKLTRRDRFLAEIDSATPWGKLHKLIEPHYPKTRGPWRYAPEFVPLPGFRVSASLAHLQKN